MNDKSDKFSFLLKIVYLLLQFCFVFFLNLTVWGMCTKLEQLCVMEKALYHLKWKLLLCLTLCDLTDYTVHGILQARILEWVAYPFSSGSSWPRNWTRVSCIAGGFFASWATRETQNYLKEIFNFNLELIQ